MGGGHSKVSPVSYEEACKRVDEKVLQRMEETFKRHASASGSLPQATFVREVIGDAAPEKLTEAIYRAFGGSQKGLYFKQLLAGLVTVVHGTKEEKAKLLSYMVSEDGEHIHRETLEGLIEACDSAPSPCAAQFDTLFKEKMCSLDSFQRWILAHPEMASFSRWLLMEAGPGMDLEGEPDSLTIHQTLSREYKVSEQDVMDVEKTYWALKGSGQFDMETFQRHVSPPLPEDLVPDIFRILDVNCDKHLDLSEVIRAISVWCSQNKNDIQSFCFSIFDGDCDGRLSREELVTAIAHMLSMKQSGPVVEGTKTLGDVVANHNTSATSEESSDQCGLDQEGSADSIADSALKEHGLEKEGFLSSSEYVSWASTHAQLTDLLPNLLFEISHIQLGVRPKTKEAETRVVGGYLQRFVAAKRKPGDVVYLISSGWFQNWMEYTGYQGQYPQLPHGPSASNPKKHRKKTRKAKHSEQHHQLHQLPVAPPTEAHRVLDSGGELMEVIDSSEAEKTPSSGHRYSADSEASILSKDDALRPPAIDNSGLCVQEPLGSKKLPSLTNEGGRLVTSRLLVEGKDFILLPEAIWKAFVTWYSSSAYNIIPALPRTVGTDGQVDLFPVFFKLYRHTTLPPPAKPSSLPWPISAIASGLGIGMPSPSPTPMPLPVGGDGELPPAQAPTPRRIPYYISAFVKTAKLSDISEKVQQMLHVKSEDLRLYDLTANENCPKLLEDESLSLQDLGFNKPPGKDGFKLLIETRNKDNTWPEEMIALVKEVQDKAKQKNSQQQSSSVQVEPGATGLSNLGNTCFMNSALQCTSNARLLTHYFQSKDHLLEINKDNPMGMQGVMAKRYGELIHELWSGNSKSITPLKFRFTVGKCAPHFTAFQQQDAQELLAFVLDGLHEDLNRVKVKPYKELKDSDDRSDEEVAQEAWDYHLSRNRSIIVDLFHGQLKSEVTCKVCQYQSKRFDPFTFLSLPLPMESTVNLEVIVMFLDGRQPIKYGLRLEMDKKYRDLKEELAELCGLPQAQLLLVEMYASNIRTLPSDTTKIRNVLGGWLYAYELPSLALLPTTRRSDSPDEKLRKRNLAKVKRERTLSLQNIEANRTKAAKVREKLARDGLRGEETVVSSDGREEEEEGRSAGEEAVVKRRKVEVQGMEVNGEDRQPRLEGVEPDLDGDHTELSSEVEDSDEVSNSQNRNQPSNERPYVFALHRRIYAVDHFFVSSQKFRPSLFSIPLVVPCTKHTIRSELYASLWKQVKRLVIPDPPNSNGSSEKTGQYPFQIKQVTKDGMSCSVCPWYRFCQGCEIPCDSEEVGILGGDYVSVDWDSTTLHLKYLLAQEKAADDESMKSLGKMETEPIDLYKCFKAFVREDQLGDEESWYCKKCKTHREAVKSLVIWRLPPILIIHLKRFQFVNGRWIKSQRAVTFPLEHLEPLRYTVQNGNGSSGAATPTMAIEGRLSESEVGVALDKEVGVASNGDVEVSPCLHCSPAKSSDPTDVSDKKEKMCNGDLEVADGVVNGGSEGAGDGEDINGGERSGEGDGVEQVGATAESAGSEEDLTRDLTKLYNLFAICCHTGVLGGGHYTSFAKNANNKWYYFNDSSCKETTPERVEQESPYMLFYEVQNIEKLANRFRAENRQGGTRSDIGAEDDREFEETLKKCTIQ